MQVGSRDAPSATDGLWNQSTTEGTAMLVITRRLNEIVRIGDAEVMVLRICGDKVRLGISAPREMQILREELVSLAKAPQPAEACCDADEDDDTEMGGES